MGWLLKTEPEEWSWSDQAANGGRSRWDGVRNAQAQKFMKNMSLGDRCFFYHTGKNAREIVGVVRVVRSFYPDPSDEQGKLGIVDVEEDFAFPRPITLAELKQEPQLKDFILFRQPRLSVMPVSDEIWDKVCSLAI